MPSVYLDIKLEFIPWKRDFPEEVRAAIEKHWELAAQYLLMEQDRRDTTEILERIQEAKKQKKDYDAQINALAKQFGHSVRDIGVLKQQIAIVGPQLTKMGGFRAELEALKAENKALRDDIAQLRLEKSGEIIKLNVEDKKIEEEVSKEVSEEVIKEVVQKAIKEKINKIPAKV